MLEQALARLLACTPTLRLATTSGLSAPWVAAAFFVERGLFDLELLLDASCRTVADVLLDPRVAVIVDGGRADTLFAQGEGHALIGNPARLALAHRLVRKHPAAAPLVRRADLLPVRLEVERWWLTDTSAGWDPPIALYRPGLSPRHACPDYA
jgi:hypothetical protein